MNFLTIKWGDKYSSDYVNNLYHMVKKNYTGEFRFICYTDDATNLECEVHPIPDDDLLHPKYYFGKEAFCFDRAKFLIFNSEEWLDCEEEDKFCYLDLDVVVQNNIDEIDILAEKPRIIHCLWQPENQIDDRFFIETRGTFFNLWIIQHVNVTLIIVNTVRNLKKLMKSRTRIHDCRCLISVIHFISYNH